MGLMVISLSYPPPPTGSVSFCVGSMNSIGLSVTAAKSLAEDAASFCLPVTTRYQ
jgi:hypothetical protein